MSTPTPGQVIVSYRGLASLLENIDLQSAAEAGFLRNEEAGDNPLVARAGDDPMGVAGAPPAQVQPVSEDLSDIDELQRMVMMSQLQKAIGEIAVADRTPGVFFVPDSQAASLLLAYMADKGLETGKLEPLKNNNFEVKFDDHDIGGWVGSFLRDWIKRLQKRPFLPPPTGVDVIGNSARIAIMGDWGSGLYGAPVCAQSIEKANPAYDVVVHLGDIYYAGNHKEVKSRFLAYWPKLPKALHRAVNANHEMYSGGEGYFDHVLPEFKQPSSVFALQNDYFLLVGLDTGYSEHDLHGGQVEWLAGLIAQAGNRKVVLFSHHQPFSVLESQGPKLIKKLRPFLSTGRIFAWYWGHEHRCMVYEKHREWQMWGRLIGHSGYPYFRKDFSGYPLAQANRDGSSFRVLAATDVAPRSAVLDGSNPYVTDAPLKYGPHGWASIELVDRQIVERIHAADGTVLHEKELL
ncbi:MAG: metallophosphoesterase [Polyangiaceae bacterium]|nr:metallophosphoesterase [Polyangiaceae bacterium]